MSLHVQYMYINAIMLHKASIHQSGSGIYSIIISANYSHARSCDLLLLDSSLGNQTLGKSERKVWEIGWGGSVPLGWNAAHF